MEELFIAAAGSLVFLVVGVVESVSGAFGACIIAEVMGFIDHDEIEIAPIEGGEVEVADFAAGSGEVGMRDQCKIEFVFEEWVVFAVILGEVLAPIFFESFGAEEEDILVAQ